MNSRKIRLSLLLAGSVPLGFLIAQYVIRRDYWFAVSALVQAILWFLIGWFYRGMD